MTSTGFSRGLSIPSAPLVSMLPVRIGSTPCARKKCGHTGAGEASQHAGSDGRGACLYRNCGCPGFVPPVTKKRKTR